MLLFSIHGKREDRHQSFLILKDFYDQLYLGNICTVFQTLLSDICLNGSLFGFFLRLSQGQSDALHLFLLRYLTKLKLILFAETKSFRRGGLWVKSKMVCFYHLRIQALHPLISCLSASKLNQTNKNVLSFGFDLPFCLCLTFFESVKYILAILEVMSIHVKL